MSGATSLPLAGIRVLDLSRLMAVNMLTLQNKHPLRRASAMKGTAKTDWAMAQLVTARGHQL